MEASIASEVLTRYQKFSERDLQGDYVAGVMDGEREYPPSNQLSFSQYEEGRIAEARTTLNRYMRRLRETVDEIDRRIAERGMAGDSGYNSNKGSIASQKAYELESLRRLKGPSSTRWVALEQSKSIADRDFEQVKWDLERQPRMSMHLPLMRFARAPFDRISIYIVLLLLLAILEIPINELAIELNFEFGATTSYLVAGFIGLIFVILAHFLGIAFLRILHSNNGKRWRAGAFAIVLLMMAGTIILTLYHMRGKVAEQTGGGQFTAAEFGGGAKSTKAVTPRLPFGERMLSLLPWTEHGGKNSHAYAQFGLFLLNTLVFFIGTVLSYVRHDPDSDFESAWRRGFDANRAFEAYEETYTMELAGLTRRFDARIDEEERRADRVRGEIGMLEQERERMKQQMANDIRLVMDVLAQQINAYQRGNEQVRRTQLPGYFGQYGLTRLGEVLLIQ